MQNNVFLNACNAAIVVTVNNKIVATDVQTADALVEVFLQTTLRTTTKATCTKVVLLTQQCKMLTC